MCIRLAVALRCRRALVCIQSILSRHKLIAGAARAGPFQTPCSFITWRGCLTRVLQTHSIYFASAGVNAVPGVVMVCSVSHVDNCFRLLPDISVVHGVYPLVGKTFHSIQAAQAVAWRPSRGPARIWFQNQTSALPSSLGGGRPFFAAWRDGGDVAYSRRRVAAGA